MADATITDVAASQAEAGPVVSARRVPSLRPGQGRKLLLPALVLVVFLAVWEYVTAAGMISRLILASPTAIAAAYFSSGGEIAWNAGVTLSEALTGFAIGNTVGLLVAILFIHSDLARRTVFPIAIGAEAIPIVAVVPVLILWLGNGMAPKMFITSFLTFFPMLINALRGLRSADTEVNELLYTLSATPMQRLFMVRLPASVPFLFNALKLSAVACVVAAIVGEWLAAEAGLGHLIVLYGQMYKVPEIWGTALVCTAMSLGVYGLTVIAEWAATPWLRRRKAPNSI